MTSKANEASTSSSVLCENENPDTGNRKRKVTEENRLFNLSWEHDFLFTMPGVNFIFSAFENLVWPSAG